MCTCILYTCMYDMYIIHIYVYIYICICVCIYDIYYIYIYHIYIYIERERDVWRRECPRADGRRERVAGARSDREEIDGGKVFKARAHIRAT